MICHCDASSAVPAGQSGSFLDDAAGRTLDGDAVVEASQENDQDSACHNEGAQDT